MFSRFTCDVITFGQLDSHRYIGNIVISKIVISGFCPIHITVTFAGTQHIHRYINNSLRLAQKYARIFVYGHYLFRDTNSSLRAELEQNCQLRGTDNVQGQISEHIFAPDGGYCLYYTSNIFKQSLRRLILETFSEYYLTSK